MSNFKKQTPMSKVLIIINPNAGNDHRLFWLVRKFLGIKNRENRFLNHNSLLNYIIDIFKRYQIEATGVFTKGKSDAKQLARQAVQENVDAVVAVGGDGTIHEVINSIANTSVMLGVIPYGTANVFGLAFNIPMDIEKACIKIIEGQPRKMDLGRINGTYFACMAGIGFDAFVIKKADRSLKQAFGALSYIMVGMWEIFRYKFYPILFNIDNSFHQQKGYFLIISNTKYYGGEQVITPKADPFDGNLEICIFNGKGVLKTLWFGVKVKFGKITHSKDVKLITCTSIRVRSFGRHNIHADAEYIGKSPAKISIAKKALLIPY